MNEQEAKYQKAKKRVEAIRGFYVHLGVYVVVNLLLFFINMVTSPDRLWFIWPLMGWGIAIVLHALRVFGAAKKSDKALRGFYVHLGAYVVVNLLLFFINMIASPDRLWFFWPLMGWGIAIALHALRVFGPGRYLGADWEEKKIKEIMENEKNESNRI